MIINKCAFTLLITVTGHNDAHLPPMHHFCWIEMWFCLQCSLQAVCLCGTLSFPAEKWLVQTSSEVTRCSDVVPNNQAILWALSSTLSWSYTAFLSSGIEHCPVQSKSSWGLWSPTASGTSGLHRSQPSILFPILLPLTEFSMTDSRVTKGRYWDLSLGPSLVSLLINFWGQKRNIVSAGNLPSDLVGLWALCSVCCVLKSRLGCWQSGLVCWLSGLCCPAGRWVSTCFQAGLFEVSTVEFFYWIGHRLEVVKWWYVYTVKKNPQNWDTDPGSIDSGS